MECLRCGKKLLQISGLWSPETPHTTYRKYICHDCNVEYTELVDTDSHEVVNIERKDLSVKIDKQVSLMEWMKV